jgi:hypothetical protein
MGSMNVITHAHVSCVMCRVHRTSQKRVDDRDHVFHYVNHHTKVLLVTRDPLQDKTRSFP